MNQHLLNTLSEFFLSLQDKHKYIYIYSSLYYNLRLSNNIGNAVMCDTILPSFHKECVSPDFGFPVGLEPVGGGNGYHHLAYDLSIGRGEAKMKVNESGV